MNKLKNLILTYLGWEGIPARYINAKKHGAVKDDLGLFTQIQRCLNAFVAGQNIILLGGVGRGKSFLAYEIAFRIKLAQLKARELHNYPMPCVRASVLVGDFKANFSNISATLNKILSYHSYHNSNFKIVIKGLIIDEIDDLSPNDYTLLNELIISAYERELPLILISNKGADSFFANFSDKALSRLNERMCLIQAQGADLRQGGGK